MALVDIQNLSFQYALSKSPSLNDVNLTVEEGDFLILFGASGSGKTTLLRHLKRELTPAGERGGQVLYRGGAIEALAPAASAREIGYVMQNPESQIVTDVVWHELAFGLENLGADTPTIRRRVAEMASFFGIGSWFHKKTAELSGGQKQLLNLASILSMQPRLLLLDEPTSQLDPIAAREFIDMVSRLNRELGLTVIMTEHRLEEVMPVSTRVVLMERGRVRLAAPPRALPAALLESGAGESLESLPCAARIFAHRDGRDCPLTVREGRERLFSLLSEMPEMKTQTRPVPAPKKGAAALECRDVFFRYAKDAPDVLCALDFRAHYGEFVCLLGENGSGKSTLLQILAGLFRPMRGSVRIDGKKLGDLKKGALYHGCVGYLPQNPKAVFLRDTLRANLPDVSGAQKLGLGDLLDRHPYDLSGGEQQKAALARVLLQKPRILLLDEPAKGLDAVSKRALAGILRELCDAGVLVIATMHDIEFAASYADRCALLFDGKIASEGEPRAFFCGNSFYTTAANRIARDADPGAITVEDVKKLCGF